MANLPRPTPVTQSGSKTWSRSRPSCTNTCRRKSINWQHLPTLPPLQVVQGLLQEVQEWRTTLPLGLVSTVEEMYQRVNTDSLQKRLTAVAQELSVTHKNKDQPMSAADSRNGTT